MENENTDRTLQIALGSYDRKELRVQKNYIQEQCAGSECTCFQNGSRLLEQLQQGRRFDAVILCSQLEDMSGLELLTELRTTEARPPVLMIDEARRQNSSILCPESGEGLCYGWPYGAQKPAVGAVSDAGTAEPADGTQVSGIVRGLGNPAAGHE